MVSCDGHIGAPVEQYRNYFEASFRNDYDTWLVHHAQVVSELRSTAGYAKTAMPGRRRPFLADDPEDGITVAEICDPAVRVKILESEGAVAEVLFPNPDFAREAGFPFGSLSGTLARDIFDSLASQSYAELIAAGNRAYNRWLADYCSELPGRAIGVLYPPRHDIDSAVAEIRAGREAGLRGVQIPSDDPCCPPYWDDYWEPLWSVCEELEMPIHFHGGTSFGDKALPAGNEDIRTALVILEGPFWYARPLKVLIYAGVLERHPGLRVVFTEFNCDWVPSMLARMELVHRDSSYRATFAASTPRPPSEYWYRQCYAGASLLSRDEVNLRANIGVGNMMYGIDFPHPEGSWLRTKPWLQQVFGGTGISETDLRQILGETAVGLYRLDANQLRPIAEQVGPSVEEIVHAEPRTADLWGGAFDYMPAPYRKAIWSPQEPVGI